MQTQVLIIGGGATGTAVVRDLALRGVRCILVEKADLNAGASGGNHGLLHSGGRYVSNDRDAARECKQEGDIIKKLMPQCVEDTGGLFVAVKGDDERFIADYPSYCAQCGVPCEQITPEEARYLEPTLSSDVIAAYRVEDASIDPFKLTLLNMSHAVSLGSRLIRRTKVIGFDIHDKKIRRVIVENADSGEAFHIEVEQVVNCAGAWANQVGRLAGIDIPISYSKGTLLVTNDRINYRVINRLRPPSDADILVPGGTVSIIGTTSTPVENPDGIHPTVEETDLIVREGAVMVPVLERSRFVRAYCGVRPLFGTGRGADGRSMSRGFALLDHSEEVENFTTITGGKLTTFRLMAEKTSDLVCVKMGITAPCRTRSEELPTTDECGWTEPGLSPKKWMRQHAADDIVICECEMVTRTAIDEIIASLRQSDEKPSLVDICMRTRLGRGACQGAFCGSRAVAYLYERGEFGAEEGLADIGRFFQERWRGIHSILWGDQLIQAELMESIHCGLFDEELHTP
ncbi:MAG: glycerol-3-phosphate dehydrogenase, anaerobic, A subunit [Spirochaetes bacterium RBG_13_51_14]|nr:MAG: glycerol-3-phosphate dehydrogenase, anaerobic, A subunit [Spirochaetes bacterium RBG_13_51_14]